MHTATLLRNLPPFAVDAFHAPEGAHDAPMDRPAPNVHGCGLDGTSTFRPMPTARAPRRTKGDLDGMGTDAPADRRCTALRETLAASLALLPPILQTHARKGKRTPEERAYLLSDEGQAELRTALALVFDPAQGLSLPFGTVARHHADPRPLRADEVGDAICTLWERETNCNLPPAELPAGKVRKVRARAKGGKVRWPFAFIRGQAIALADREGRAARKRTVGMIDQLAHFGSDDAYSPANVIRYLRERIGGRTGATASVAMGKLLDGGSAAVLTDDERKRLHDARPLIEQLLSKGLDSRGARVARSVLPEERVEACIVAHPAGAPMLRARKGH